MGAKKSIYNPITGKFYHYTISPFERRRVGKDGNEIITRYFRATVHKRLYDDGDLGPRKQLTGQTKSEVERKVQAHYQRLFDEAKAKADKEAAAAEQGTDAVIIPTVAELADAFFSNRKIKNNGTSLSPNTVTSYRILCNKHIIPVIGSIRINEIKRLTLQNLLNNMCETYQRSTVSKIRTLLSLLFQHAVLMDYIEVSPATQLSIQRALAPKKEAYSEEEQKVILKALEISPKRLALHYGLERDDDYRVGFSIAVGLMLYCGLRQCETFVLTVDDIDMENKCVIINKEVIFPDKNRATIVDHTKTSAGIRAVPVPDEFAEKLYPYVRDKIEKGEKYLFTGKSDEPYNYSAIKRRWQTFTKLCAEIAKTFDPPVEMSHMTMHRLRHTYATMLYETGIPDIERSLYMGHSEVTVTNQVYTDIRKGKRSEVDSAIRAISYKAFDEGGED